MRVLKVFPLIVSVFLSALTGNWVGGQIRIAQTGQPFNPLICEFETDRRRYRNFPSLTRFYPAVLFAALAKPRWFWAFAGGVLLGLIVDERLEQALLKKVFSYLEG